MFGSHIKQMLSLIGDWTLMGKCSETFSTIYDVFCGKHEMSEKLWNKHFQLCNKMLKSILDCLSF